MCTCVILYDLIYKLLLQFPQGTSFMFSVNAYMCVCACVCVCVHSVHVHVYTRVVSFKVHLQVFK